MIDEAAAKRGRSAVGRARVIAETVVKLGKAEDQETIATALSRFADSVGWSERNARLVFGAALFWAKAQARGLVGQRLDDEMAAYRARVQSGEIGETDTVVSD